MGKVSFFFLCAFASLFARPQPDELYSYEIKNSWLRMRDGVSLSVTYFIPDQKKTGETFPTLFELLPYRKEDFFSLRDYPLYSYFAQRGFLLARVDVRGTGSSQGAVPEREYSDQEMQDSLECISQIARHPLSNGNVGMWGISWGGFNAIQTMLLRPPELKAIIAVDASDDLYHDDIHFIDGILHIDSYTIDVEGDVAFPQSPEYRLDDAYFRDRFDRFPWFLTYLKQQRDGDFWRSKSFRFQQNPAAVPTYLVGGLLDGYRDSIPRMLEKLSVPVRAEIGPWPHSFPQEGSPGPNYEWRSTAVDWWNKWLVPSPSQAQEKKEADLTFFLRDSHLPDLDLIQTPGQWKTAQWPLKNASLQTYFLTQEHGLSPQKSQGVHALKYIPTSGTEIGNWWGDLTEDVSGADQHSLVYDSAVLEREVVVLGIPQVELEVATDAKRTNWIVRLEDVHPNGKVSLVTGGALNGSQRKNRLQPMDWIPGKKEETTVPMRFTTWTFPKGHRIRVAVSNAQFPMLWPTPYPMTTKVFLRNSHLTLPAVSAPFSSPPSLPEVEEFEEKPGTKVLTEVEPSKATVIKDPVTHQVTVSWKGAYDFSIDDKIFKNSVKTAYTANDLDPAHATFEGESLRILEWQGRTIRLFQTAKLRSDKDSFHVLFTRQISENGKTLRTKTLQETIPRDFQ